MADAAELKDLAWENQWTVVSRRIELLSSLWLPGSSGLNQQDYSNHMGLGGRVTADQCGGCWAPGFHREGLRATKLGLLKFCRPALPQPCLILHLLTLRL